MKSHAHQCLTLLLAGALALNSAAAGDRPAGADDSEHLAPAVFSRNQLKAAVEAAAREAAESVKASSRLDLDIRLIGPTSVKVAAD